MALLGNYTITNKSLVRFLAGSAASVETGGRASVQRNGSERNRFYIDQNTTAIKTWGEPSASYPPNSFTILPQKGSWLSSRRETWASFPATATGLRGMPGEGAATFAVTTNTPSILPADDTSPLRTGASSFAITTNTPSILPADDTSPLRTGTASFSVTTNQATGQLIAFGQGSTTFAVTTNTPSILPADDTSPLRTGTSSFAVTTNTPLLVAFVNGVGSTTFAISFSTATLGAKASLIATSSFAITTNTPSILPTNSASPLRTGTSSFSITTNTPIIFPLSGSSPLRTGTATFAITTNTPSILPVDDTSPLRTGIATLTITANAQRYATGSMIGSALPYTELSPQSLASAVWDSLLIEYQQDGSTGKALSTASSGGVDLNLMAQANWAYTTRTLTSGEVSPQTVATAVWDSLLTNHQSVGSAGKTLTSIDVSPQDIASAVWNSEVTDYQTAGSTGKTLTDLEVSPQDVASAVWDTTLSAHQTAGSTGKTLNTIESEVPLDLDSLAQAVWAHVSRTLTSTQTIPTVQDIVIALQTAILPVNITQVKGQSINGTGSEVDPWGP